MNQPPQHGRPSGRPSAKRAAWLRPIGVAEGTWAYTQQRSIADHYSDFVDATPLCELDQQFLVECFPRPNPAVGRPTPLILDLGCGDGRSLLSLMRRGYRGLGVDLSEPMLQAFSAKEVGEKSQGKAWKLRCNLVELDGLADDSVDHAICMFSTLGMVHGGQHRQAVLRHARRVVRKNGTLVLHVHHRWSQWNEPGGKRKLWASFLRSRWSRDHDFGDQVYAYRGLERMFLHRFSRREVVRLLESSGWVTDSVRAISLDGRQFIPTRWWNLFRVGGFMLTGK
ncbi:MAG: class I SAM-dependent methyltransferase [Planctomycetota bacterium]